MVLRAPKRYLRDKQNPFEFFNDREFKRRFRFSKVSVMFGILPLIEEGLAKINNRDLPISPVLQLLICLRFYATASFQLVMGDVIQISQSTISRIIFRVSCLIASNMKACIKMPTDCSHIRLTHTKFQHINEVYRKGYFSLNVQV
ncbi:Putative nuclease HARBI1 [Trachymyrmex zeteki]|uniref:Putative nuclease HARBI1 n=1 Tax=Mycetomoellerius zeteki TaxID=64791 RepID=A0A151WS72_9HYME|nr:Putative nuclease HARBI1 [Trachymyrmex zeteki]